MGGGGGGGLPTAIVNLNALGQNAWSLFEIDFAEFCMLCSLPQ